MSRGVMPSMGRARVRRVLAALALLHPFPSALNALVVLALAWLAGASAGACLALAIGMLGFQVSIGSLNDLVDAERDRTHKPGNPIATGLVSPGAAWPAVAIGAGLGLAVSAAFGPAVLLVGAAGYACGIAYDLVARSRGLGWLCFAAAFPLLLVWTWLAATGELPPGWQTLLPIAALAGPALNLANGLVDVERDQGSGVPGLAVRLGRRRGVLILGLLVLVVHGAAWLTLRAAPSVPVAATAAALSASCLALAGVAASAAPDVRIREFGWMAQAISIGLLAVAWLATWAS